MRLPLSNLPVHTTGVNVRTTTYYISLTDDDVLVYPINELLPVLFGTCLTKDASKLGKRLGKVNREGLQRDIVDRLTAALGCPSGHFCPNAAKMLVQFEHMYFVRQSRSSKGQK